MAVGKDHNDTSWGSCFNWNFGGLLIQGTKRLKYKRTNICLFFGPLLYANFRLMKYQSSVSKKKGPIMSHTILNREKDASGKPK